MTPLPALSRLPTTRREFLSHTLLAGAAAATVLTGTTTLPAAGPVKRNGKSHMKLSLAAYSFRQALTSKTDPMSLEDFVRYCASLDLDGTELTSYYFPANFGPEYLANLKQLTFKLGLDVSGTAIGNDFCVVPGEKRDAQLALCRKWIDHAAALGAPVIRIFAGTLPKGDDLDAAIKRCAEGINQSLKYAAEKGVCLALENHGGITATPEMMFKIIEQIDNSPFFGVNLDSGNFYTADPYADLAKIAPYAINAQIKTEIKADGKSVEADLERKIKILRDAGYRGYVVLEYEAKEDAKVAVPRHIEQLRKLIRG